MLTSCLKFYLKNGVARRYICTSNISRSWTKRIKSFLTSADVENFETDSVKRSHKWDKMDEKEWSLIYKDIGASRTFFMTSAFLPCFILGSAVFIYDTWNNKPEDRLGFVRKFTNDAEELGVLIVIPSIALSLVVALLIRVQSLRLLRIYQNRTDVDQYVAIRSNCIVTQKKHKFHRNESTAFYYAEEQTDGLRVVLNFLFGNIRIGENQFMTMDDQFKANNYRSYMLNETSVPPRLS